MNSLRCCGPRVPVPDPEIGLRPGNDPGGLPMWKHRDAKSCWQDSACAGRGQKPLAIGAVLHVDLRVKGGCGSFLYRTGRHSRPLAWRLGRRTCASGGSLLSTRCREGGGLRVFGVRRVRPVGELASPARLDEWATRLLGHLLVADVLGRLLAGRRALHKLLAEFLREVVVRGAADELLRLLPPTRGSVLFAEVVPKQRFLVGHVGQM